MQLDLSQLQPPEAGELVNLGKSRVRSRFLGALVVVLGLLTFFFYNFQTVVVSGKSMLPTLRDKQRILICKALWLVGAPKHNDIVVVISPESNDLLVKRVYRLGGETVDDLIYSPRGWDIFANGLYQVPADSLYLIGDNINNSEDSRTFGPVKESELVGKMVAR